MVSTLNSLAIWISLRVATPGTRQHGGLGLVLFSEGKHKRVDQADQLYHAYASEHMNGHERKHQ